MSPAPVDHLLRAHHSWQHDGTYLAVPFFRFINAIEDCSFLTEVTPWTQEQTNILLVPHGCWPQPLPDGYHAVFAHETFAGAQAEHGHPLKGLRLPLSSVPVFSGDVHVPQRQGTVIDAGAPTLIRFGDSYSPRVLLMDLNKGCEPVVKSIPIEGPTKRLVEGHVHPDGAIDWHNIEVLARGDIVKVRFTFEGEIPSLAHLRANVIDDISANGATLHSIDVGSAVSKTASTPRNPVSRSDADLVRQYGGARSLSQPSIKAGLSIVEGK